MTDKRGQEQPNDSGEGIVVRPGPVSIGLRVAGPTLWRAENFAEDWLDDAVNASSIDGIGGRRREIVLSVCFVESYLFEWTRRQVSVEELNDFFPVSSHTATGKKNPNYRRPLKRKWKKVPRELFDAKKIGSRPNLDLSMLGTLITYRDGLVHAAASRHDTFDRKHKSTVRPTKEDLGDLKPGWAVSIVVDLVRDLHRQLGQDLPTYVNKLWPEKSL